jgi:MoxR-like ATPase
VLVSGEAGIGKSLLIERFTELEGEFARFLWGRCEALFTPRPLGPPHDIAQQVQGPVRELLEREVSNRPGESSLHVRGFALQ